MPTNLNALIRYKQIDLCLKNPYLKTTIAVMQEKCSEQLAEHRGVYKLVSERTIRDDIRTMRSDALGFNAPIIVRDGVYQYTNENYSIFDTSISEMDLLKEVIKLLLEEREHIKSPNLNRVLVDLSGITGIDIEDKKTIDMNEVLYSVIRGKEQDENRILGSFHLELPTENRELKKSIIKKKQRIYSWERILEVL